MSKWIAHDKKFYVRDVSVLPQELRVRDIVFIIKWINVVKFCNNNILKGIAYDMNFDVRGVSVLP